MNMVLATMNESEVEIDDTDTAASPQADDATLDQSAPAAERLDLPLSPSTKSTAAVYVRQQPYDLGDEPLDSSDPAPTRYESIGLFNGEQVFYGDGYTSRKFAIEDAERAIAHAAATLSVNSKKKAHKLAAEELNNLLTAVENIASADGEDIPAGEACEWPGCAEGAGEQAEEEQPADEQPTDEQTANAGLAGSGEITGAEPSLPAAVSPAPARKPTLEEIIADFESDMVAVARRLASVVLRRKAIEADLKDVKEDEKRVVGELEALTDRGPEFMPLFDAKSGESIATSPASQSEGAAAAVELSVTAEDLDAKAFE